MSVEKTYQAYVTCKYIHVTIVIAPMICDDTMILCSVVFLSFEGHLYICKALNPQS